MAGSTSSRSERDAAIPAASVLNHLTVAAPLSRLEQHVKTIKLQPVSKAQLAQERKVVQQMHLASQERRKVEAKLLAQGPPPTRPTDRPRTAKVTLTNVGTLAIGLVIGGNVGELARQGGGLLALRFNRDDERDADLVGLELAARAGYDPQAGITLWQKMAQAAKGTPPAWLSSTAA